MGRYFEGETAPFYSIAQRRRLVGKTIRYLRDCDIDKSGRGYLFPKVGHVVEAYGVQLILEGGNSVVRGDLVEVQVIEETPK